MQPQTTHLDANVHEQQQPTKMQPLDSHDSESNSLLYRLPDLPSASIRDGETFAYYVKDGTAYLKPVSVSSETNFIDWVLECDRVVKANAYPYQRIYLYVSTMFAMLNIIPSLVLLVVYRHLLYLWLGFFLTICIAAIGVYDLTALYHKKGNRHIAISIIYVLYSFITIFIYSTDLNQNILM